MLYHLSYRKPAVKGFAERFTEAQKASQAMRHFLPKRSSPAAAQSRPRTAPTQQPAKPAPAVFAPQPARTQQPRGRSCSARCHPPPKRQGPRLKIALDPAPPASSWSAGQEEERVESRHSRTAHQKASHEKPLGTPFFSGCRGNCVCCYRVRTSDHATVRCDSGKNKTQTFSKREQFSSSVPHECPASVQPATRVYPTPCHAGRGLAGHPRSVRVGYGDNKTRLINPIRSKTPALRRHGLHLGAGRERSRSALRGDDAAGKRSHRNGFSSFEWVRLLQPLLPRPQKGWRPLAHPRSQTPESRPHETAVQDDNAEADPLADSTGPTSSFMHSPRSPCFHRSSGVSGNRVTRCYRWPPCGGTNLGCQSWLSYWQQPPGPCPWDGISSLRRMEQYGTLDPSCGLSTFGRSMGAYRPPRVSVKHHFWG